MQVTAIIAAAIKCRKEGIKVLPEIMIPLTMDKKEFKIMEVQTRKVAEALDQASRRQIAVYGRHHDRDPARGPFSRSDRGSGGIFQLRHQ